MVKKLVIAVVVLAVLGIGGVFFYAKVIDGNAPEKLSLGSSSATTAKSSGDSGSSGDSASAAGSVDGTWQATKDSTVGYRVTEDFVGGLTNAEAVGRTNAVKGSLTISGTTVTGSEFTVDMTKVKSDRSQRDEQFQGRIMDTSRFPTATFQFTKPIDLGTVPAEGQTITKSATGKLTLHGTTHDVTVDVNAKRDGDKIEVQGAIPVKFADYGIPNPTNVVVTTRDHGTLEFLLAFTKSS